MVKKKITEIAATWFYTGYSPVAPGTAGTTGALIVYLIFLSGLSPLAYLVVLVVLIVFAIYVSTIFAFELGEEDPGCVVIDEVSGYLVTMLFIPFGIKYAIAGFMLFRFFDIVKPFPAGRLEKLPMGYGIVLDDIAAGIWSNIVLHIITLYFK